MRSSSRNCWKFFEVCGSLHHIFFLIDKCFSGSSVVIEMFFKAIAQFNPDLVILTGVHLLQNQVSKFLTLILTSPRSLGSLV